MEAILILLKVFPTDCISPVTKMTLFGLFCVMKSIFVRMERNASEVGDLGLAMTTQGSLEFTKLICPMIGKLVIFSMSLRVMILVLK